MIDVRIASSEFDSLRESLLNDVVEQCAVLLATRATRNGNVDLLLVRDTIFPGTADYIESDVDRAVLRPEFVARVAKLARSKDLSLIFVHTHLGESVPRFSAVDDFGEKELSAFLTRRGQSVLHAALVISKGGVDARVLASHEQVRVTSVGRERNVLTMHHDDGQIDINTYDRQIRAFGEEGQRTLNSLRVAIVGLGGTGSIVAESLVHLGVRDFTLIDFDELEQSNLNRVVNSISSDVGRSKTEIATRYISRFARDSNVLSINGDVIFESVARKLIDADVIFSCTDSHGSRSVVQQIAYQYLLPCIDMGTTITTTDGKVTGIFGRVQLIGPNHPCLWCSGLLNSEEVRRDMMTERERRLDPYIADSGIRAPAVISLNATVVSIAVTMLLGLTTDVPVKTESVIYNAMSSSMRSVRAKANDECFICSQVGVLAQGDSHPIYARRD